MSTLEMQIANRSREHTGEALTNLHSFIDIKMLNESFMILNTNSKSGVDGQTWTEYNEERMTRISKLYTVFKSGKYRAPHVRRAYIDKGDGNKRPLGVPTVEDKLLQTAVNRVLTPIYEQIFLENSYGFRPGKSAHQALEKLFKEVSFKGMRYVIDADIKNYFGSINHQRLREFLDLRIKDGVIRKQIDKWLKAGIMERGQVRYPKQGTPQGGSISPLLSNIYLHYVLDEWYVEQIEPLLKGKSYLIRYADDFLVCFTNKEDACRVMKVLPKRLEKYSLTLHPEKTKMVELGERSGSKIRTFDFLGFTHYLSKSRKGYPILKRKTSSKKLSMALKRMNKWIKENRHIPVDNLIFLLNLKLKGYYAYYGITFNSRRLDSYYEQVKRILHKWLNRKGGKPNWLWERYVKLVDEWLPLAKPRIYHSYLKVKPNSEEPYAGKPLVRICGGAGR